VEASKTRVVLLQDKVCKVVIRAVAEAWVQAVLIVAEVKKTKAVLHAAVRVVCNPIQSKD
jgi:hypothetical protein